VLAGGHICRTGLFARHQQLDRPLIGHLQESGNFCVVPPLGLGASLPRANRLRSDLHAFRQLDLRPPVLEAYSPDQLTEPHMVANKF